MKKIKNILLLSIALLCIASFLTACAGAKIVPDGYVDSQFYTNSNSGQLNSTLELSIYYYDEAPSFAKNKFIKPVNQETKNLLEFFLELFIEAIKDYDFQDKFDLNLENISLDDFAYLDYGQLQGNSYFSIYYYEVSQKTLYYCYLKYPTS